MPAEISNILSEWFYENRLRSSIRKQNLKSIFPDLFQKCLVIIDTGSALKHNENKKKGYTNPYEANLVTKLLEYLLDENYSYHIQKDEIGVISPYREQIKLINQNLRKIPGVDIYKDEIASTLDSFQGQERDVIIYSCTRSNKSSEKNPKRIGFLSETRRLNVALSRAKKMLIFVGDIPFLSSCTFEEGKYSPREFSDFIKLLNKRVDEGAGQYMTSNQLLEKIQELKYGK